MPPEQGAEGAGNDLSLADTIGAAIDLHDESPDATPGQSPPDAGNTPPAGESSTEGKPEGQPAEGGAARDALGRFLPKGSQPAAKTGLEGAKATGTPQGAPQAPIGQPAALQAPAQPAVGAPQSWTPAAREVWAQLPAAAQQEVIRREREMAQAMTENASARNIASAFSQACTPYLGRMKMQGVTPLQAFDNLLQTESRLGLGTPIDKANVIAQLIKAYGVDIQTLDSVLVGETPTGQAAVDSQVQQLVQQQLAPVQQFMQTIQQAQQARTQRTQAEIATEIETFAGDPKNEFFDLVRPLMADLVEVAGNNNLPITMQEAYDRAVQLHPQTRDVVAARQQQQVAAGLNGAAQRARRAAVTVTGSPALGNPDAPEPSTLRDAISAAWDAGQRV